jgi:hypothetical protein
MWVKSDDRALDRLARQDRLKSRKVLRVVWVYHTNVRASRRTVDHGRLILMAT